MTRNRFRDAYEVSGLYQFRTDPGNVGETESWHTGLARESCREIAVPASWNEQYRDLDDYLGTAWYERIEHVPESWKGRRVMLRVGAASYQSRAWINGSFVGEHEGGSLPFEFDISGVVHYGAMNRIVFSVNAESRPDRVPPGDFPKPEWVSEWQGQFPANNYDFYPYGGIHRPVYLYCLPSTHISRLSVRTDVDAGRGLLSVRMEAHGSLFSRVKVAVDGACAADIRKSSDTAAEGTVVIDNPRLWDVGAPNLYRITVTLEDNGQEVDEHDLMVGIRTVTVSGRKLLLNGKPVFMKGFGKHEDFMVIGKGLNHALMVKDFGLLDWIGANSFRTSHYPYSEEMMDYADRHGILVIDETPMVGLMKRNYSPEYLQKCKGIVRELVDRDRNHPSVIMWSVANEPTSTEKESESFFKELYSFTKSLDDTRPATLVTCMGIDDDVAIKCFDVICLNRYYGWYSHPGQLDEACRVLDADLERFRRVYDKPLILTEFGADAVAGMHGDPPRQWTEEYQAEMLTRQYQIMRGKDFVAGAHVWAFADFKTSQIYMRVLLNHKGVFTRERQPKIAAHALRALWRAAGDTRSVPPAPAV